MPATAVAQMLAGSMPAALAKLAAVDSDLETMSIKLPCHGRCLYLTNGSKSTAVLWLKSC